MPDAAIGGLTYLLILHTINPVLLNFAETVWTLLADNWMRPFAIAMAGALGFGPSLGCPNK